MGNHEYNAICYHTRKSVTDWLRPHSESKFRQHENFLKELPVGNAETREVIEWFKTLPLFLDLGSFRVIHACWDSKMIQQAQQTYLLSDNSLNMAYLTQSATKGTSLFQIIERLLKGVEVKLPGNTSFKDKYDKERHHIRVKWWKQTGKSYHSLAFGYGKITDCFPDTPCPDSSEISLYGKNEKPVFFGHYWLAGRPEVQRKNVCCVDYSAGTGKKLVCYSLKCQEDHAPLDQGNFVSLVDFNDLKHYSVES
jgi:hypothetical protein